MEHEVCGSRGTMASRPAACGFVDNPPGGTRQGRWVLSGLSTNPQAHHPQASKKDTSDEGRPTRLSPGPKGTFLLGQPRGHFYFALTDHHTPQVGRPVSNSGPATPRGRKARIG